MKNSNISNDELLLFIFGELSKTRQVAVRKAVAEDSELAAAVQSMEAAVKTVQAENVGQVSDEFNDRLRRRTLEMLDCEQVRTTRQTLFTRSLTNWRCIMRQPVSRVSAAVIFVFAILGAVMWFSMGGTKVALADFIDSITAVKSAKFKIIIETDGKPSEASQSMFLAPNRFRHERHGTIMICDPETRKMIMLLPKKKRAHITNFTNIPENIATQNWFARLQSHLLETKDDPDVKKEALGEKEIDGRLAVGYRLTMPTAVTTLWGDPKTGLPIRVEQEFAANPELKKIMTDFAFDVDLDESLFSVEPPEGYSVNRVQLDASKPNEKDLLDSLRSYSDLFNGAFPDSFVVNDRTMNPIMEKICEKKGWKNWKKTKGIKPNQEQLQALVKNLSEVTRGSGFVASLLPEADAHYAGKGVSLGAKDTPIFWYRPKGAEKYRVIYADLSVHEAKMPPNVADAQPVPHISGQKK